MILALVPIAILFKLMFWPGAIIGMLISIPVTFILLVVTFFLYKSSGPELHTYYKNYLTRITFWLAMAFIFSFMARRQLLQIQHHDNNELLELKTRAYENPDNIEYQEALENYYRQQDSLYMINKRNELIT